MEIQSKSISLVATDNVMPNPKNVHKHTDEQIDRLAKLIKNTGFRDPLIISNLSGFIVCGHGRYLAAKKLGMKFLPVVYQDFKDAAEEYSFLVSHNAIGKNEWASLDLAQINADFIDFGPEFDLELLGLKDFSMVPMMDFEDEKTLDSDSKKYIIEVQFVNDMEMMDIHDDLVSRGYIVKIK
jgi:hypothetical protein